MAGAGSVGGGGSLDVRRSWRRRHLYHSLACAGTTICVSAVTARTIDVALDLSSLLR